MPYVLTAATIADPDGVCVVAPEDVPNPGWLLPGTPSAGQQRFGDALLREHKFTLIPSAVSSHSWNVIFAAGAAAGWYVPRHQARFVLDTRPHPPPR